MKCLSDILFISFYILSHKTHQIPNQMVSIQQAQSLVGSLHFLQLQVLMQMQFLHQVLM